MTALSLFDVYRHLVAVRFSPGVLFRMLRTSRIVEGVCAARTVVTARACGLLEVLRHGTLTEEALISKLNMPAHRLRVLLDAGLHFGLLAGCRDGLRLTALSRDFAEAHNPLYASVLAYCDANVCRGQTAAVQLRDSIFRGRDFYGHEHELGEAAVANFGTYMAHTAVAPAKTLAQIWDLTTVSQLADVGGGFGVFSATLAAQNPHLKATVFELKAVTPAAEAWLRQANAERVQVQSLDFLREPIPHGFDAILFSRVLHDWDRPTVEHLLAAARTALRSGGLVAIFEVLRQRDLGNPQPVVIAAWEVAMGSPGEVRSADDYSALLTAAGFTDIQIQRPFDPVGWNSLVTARV